MVRKRGGERLTFFVLKAATTEVDDLDRTLGGVTEQDVLAS